MNSSAPLTARSSRTEFALYDWASAPADERIIGGEAAHLAALARSGVPVFDGFVARASAVDSGVAEEIANTVWAASGPGHYVVRPSAVSSPGMPDRAEVGFAGGISADGHAALVDIIDLVMWTQRGRDAMVSIIHRVDGILLHGSLSACQTPVGTTSFVASLGDSTASRSRRHDGVRIGAARSRFEAQLLSAGMAAQRLSGAPFDIDWARTSVGDVLVTAVRKAPWRGTSVAYPALCPAAARSSVSR